MNKNTKIMLFGFVSLLLLCCGSLAVAAEPTSSINEARLVAQYNYTIHILAMLLVGFGF